MACCFSTRSDEIGELGLDEQAMLLKAIEEKRFFPLGSDREVESDFLIIAGTHRDFLDFELERHAREQGQLARFNAQARRRYLTFACSEQASWLGNFRELSASITRMATLADS